jgi:uncharacterized repeat protein (TIGR01451 family)
MRLCVSTVTVCLLAAVLLAGVASAGPNYYHKAAVCVIPHGVTCSTMPKIESCSGITTTYSGEGDIDVIPVFFDLKGCTVMEFGLTWPAEWGSCAYTTCVEGLSIGQIAAPGDAIATAWQECQTGLSISHGHGWLRPTGPGVVALVRSSKTNWIGVVDCRDPASERGYDWPAAVFSAGVGGTPGEDPCGSLVKPLELMLSAGLAGSCAHRGDTLTYRLAYGNSANPTEIHDIVLVFAANYSGVDFLSASSAGAWDPIGGDVVWNLETLAPGETGYAEVALLIKASAESTLTATCRIAGDRTPLGADTLVTTVCKADFAPLDLTVAAADTACIKPGANIDYTIEVANKGNTSEIHNVTVKDRLPREVDFKSAASGGIFDRASRTITWSLENLGPGQSRSVEAVVKVKTGPGGTIENTCEVRATEPVSRSASARSTMCGARPSNPAAKLAIHVMAHGTRCSGLPKITACDQIVTSYAGCGDVDFLPVFFDLNEVARVDLGLTWPAEWGSCQFVTCGGDIWVGQIGHSGEGAAVGWASCQRAWSVQLGYGWLHASSAGRICPTPNPMGNRLGVTNCQSPGGVTDSLEAVYCGGVCGAAGDAPCPAPSAAGRLWRDLKSVFR